MNVEITLSDADKAAICQQVVQSLVAELCRISPDMLRKHAYTVNQVAEQISYSRETVLGFIHNGRTARNGKKVYLIAKEPTNGDYRVLPGDLDKFLAQF